MQGFLEVNYRNKMLFNPIKDLLWEELIAWSKWTNKNIDRQINADDLQNTTVRHIHLKKKSLIPNDIHQRNEWLLSWRSENI